MENSSKENKKLTGYASIDKPWLKYYEEGIYDKSAITEECPRKSMYQNLIDKNKGYKKQNIMKYLVRDITFEELNSNIEKAAKAFKQQGIKKRDIVTLCMPTVPETIYAFYALNRIGAIANMVDPRTSAEGIKEYISEVNSDIVLTLDVFKDKIASFVDDENLNIKRVITVSPADSLPIGLQLGYNAKQYFNRIKNKDKKIENNKFIKWSKFIEQGKNYCGKIDEEYEENTPALIVHTGGTTGKPKGVIITNEDFNNMIIQYDVLKMGLERNEKYLNIMPPFIAYGVFGFHLTMCLGVNNIIIPSFNPDEFDTLILKYKPSIIMGVPTHFEKLTYSEKLKEADLSFLRLLASGGDHMKPELEERINSFLAAHKCKYRVTEGYGMSELSASACTCTHKHNKLNSVGLPLCKNTFAVFKPGTKEELKYNEFGEICVAGPTKMLKYFNNEEETNKVMQKHEDGKIWVHTGDIGYITEDGFVYIVDRIKRMIIRHDGFKVFPYLIENVISSHPAVLSCAVVGMPDVNYIQGKVPQAHIVLKDEYMGKEDKVKEEIENMCKEKLPEYVQPSQILFKKSLPITPIGKIDFKSLEEENKDNRRFVDDEPETIHKENGKPYVKKKKN